MTRPFSLIMASVRNSILWHTTTAHFVAENETEVSFFSRELYEEFKKNPEVSTIRNFPRNVSSPFPRQNGSRGDTQIIFVQAPHQVFKGIELYLQYLVHCNIRSIDYSTSNLV